MLEAILGVLLFTGIVMCLVLVILGVRSRLAVGGEVQLVVNGEGGQQVPAGTRLQEALNMLGVRLPAACGGRGTCGLCAVEVVSGAGPTLPVELDVLPRDAVARGMRLACQVTLRGDLAVRVPDEALGVHELVCRVRSNRNVATFIKELVLELPPGEELTFRAGAFVQVTCPPFRAKFTDFDVEEEFHDAWKDHDLWRYEASAEQPTTRAYSLANHPGEKDVVVLDVRIAPPPPGSGPEVPPGVVSSYIFNLKPGDDVEVRGPFGNFFASETDAEMVFVGGGAGMAPMRSHVFDQLENLGSSRRISFWYGARSLRELFYVEDFDRLQAEHENFQWVVALSEPGPEEDWRGEVGFIHAVLYERYLKDHPAPETCEYYLCGPPMMVRATRAMLDDLGVPPEQVRFDDFGG